jgi:EAL domain-containing protein (putative c-di-GMP-specific phosphodiesterase class I)
VLEFTENEEIADTGHLQNIVESYRKMGFATVLNDFGAGYAGLGLLGKFQPDLTSSTWN